MESSVTTVLGFCAIWSSFYFSLRQLNPKRSSEWHCRLVTAVHATTVCLLCLWCAFVQGPWPFNDMVSPTTPLQNTTIMVCLGYFLFDLSWCCYYQTEGPVMMLHHTISILGMSVGVLTGRYGSELIATIFGSEISNPLLQLRWFVRETNNHKSLMGDIIDHAFMLTFGFFRIGIGSCLLYSYFRQDTDNLGRFGAVVIYGISWTFWVNIIQYAIKKYKRRLMQRSTNSTKKESINTENLNGSVSNTEIKSKSLLTNGHHIETVKDAESSNIFHRNGNCINSDNHDKVLTNENEDSAHLRKRFNIEAVINNGEYSVLPNGVN